MEKSRGTSLTLSAKAGSWRKEKFPRLELLVGLAAILLYIVATPGLAQTRNDAEQDDSKRGGSRILVSGKPLHISCNRSVRNLEKNQLECFGNVYIRRPAELLTSDYALMDLNNDQLHAEGNVVYFTPDTVIYGAKMDFNFVTETGTITDGRVESDRYQLLGETIERRGSDRFYARDGEYTTCRDCPASWKLVGRTIDMKIDGYANLSQVFIKLNEAPTLYVPYIIIPIKTKRQTGLLFPRTHFGGSNGQFSFVQPFFWAISRSQDATLGAGYYSAKGAKAELEYRYAIAPGSQGQLNFFYLRDRAFIRDPYYNRWGATYEHNIKLPFGFEQKAKFLDTSDRDYARLVGDPKISDVAREPARVSDAGIGQSGRVVSGFVTGKYIHNNLTKGMTGFDHQTVQQLPAVTLSSTDHEFVDGFPLRWGVTANYSRFWREGDLKLGDPNYDTTYKPGFVPTRTNQFVPGDTPLRRAHRFQLVPELYYSVKIADVLEVLPSVQYRTFYYDFNTPEARDTARGFLLAQTEVGTTIEHVYGKRIKHKFRPSLTYSNIPVIQENRDHPFIQQIGTKVGTTGNQFDDFDIVPVTNETQQYFIPLGNSLSYRFGNKWILKSDIEKGEALNYRTVVDWTAGQSINFIEYRKSVDDKRHPFSRFFSLLTVSTMRLQGTGEYYYYPYSKKPTYNIAARYIFAKYNRRLINFERSLGLNYNFNGVVSMANNVGGTVNWSITDSIGINGGIAYTLPMTVDGKVSPGVVTSANAGLVYQSLSQCYRLTLNVSTTAEQKKLEFSPMLLVNLTGDSFMNLQDPGSMGSITGGARQ